MRLSTTGVVSRCRGWRSCSALRVVHLRAQRALLAEDGGGDVPLPLSLGQLHQVRPGSEHGGRESEQRTSAKQTLQGRHTTPSEHTRTYPYTRTHDRTANDTVPITRLPKGAVLQRVGVNTGGQHCADGRHGRSQHLEEAGSTVGVQQHRQTPSFLFVAQLQPRGQRRVTTLSQARQQWHTTHRSRTCNDQKTQLPGKHTGSS